MTPTQLIKQAIISYFYFSFDLFYFFFWFYYFVFQIFYIYLQLLFLLSANLIAKHHQVVMWSISHVTKRSRDQVKWVCAQALTCDLFSSSSNLIWSCCISAGVTSSVSFEDILPLTTLLPPPVIVPIEREEYCNLASSLSLFSLCLSLSPPLCLPLSPSHLMNQSGVLQV